MSLRRLKGWLERNAWARLLGTAVLLLSLLLLIPREQLLTALHNISVPMLAASLPVYLLLHLAGAWKWRLLVKRSGTDMPLVQSIQCYYSGLFGNLFLPSVVGGDAVMVTLAMQRTERRAGVLVGSFLNRALDLLALLLLTAVSAALIPSALTMRFRAAFGQVAAVAGVVALLGIVVVGIVRPARPAGRVRQLLARHGDALAILREPRLSLGPFVISVAIQFGLLALTGSLANAGTSSSSALVVAWTAFLLATQNGNLPHEREDVARFAHKAEVVEFDEPGGMMDHYASAVGGLLHIDCREPITVTHLAAKLEGFVLGDTGVPKNTTGTLRGSRDDTRAGLGILKRHIPDFDLRRTPLSQAEEYFPLMPENVRRRVRANFINRDLCVEARELLSEERVADEARLGRLLYEHQVQLRDGIGVSHPRLDALIEAGMAAGALGGKLNGSGCGGCMFVYAPGSRPRSRKRSSARAAAPSSSPSATASRSSSNPRRLRSPPLSACAGSGAERGPG